tara:strand:+ start:10823 stop:11416 length:594 start_codon:yes stop_codon:yes gene_type:complete
MKEFDNYRDIIVDYWFSKKYMEWMMNGKKYDEEMTEKFEFLLEHALHGKLHHWKNTKKGFLAYVILLDQMPRHIYRGNYKSYQFDDIVCKFVKLNYMKYIDRYSPVEQMFALMPLQHSESIEDQNLGISILEGLIKDSKSEADTKFLEEVLFHQKGHYEVIKKYGRFPKRNIFFKNRINSKEEQEYLKSERNSNKPY